MFTATPKRSAPSTPFTPRIHPGGPVTFSAKKNPATPSLYPSVPQPVNVTSSQVRHPTVLLSHDTHSVLLLCDLPDGLEIPSHIPFNGALVKANLGHIVFESGNRLLVWNSRRPSVPPFELILPVENENFENRPTLTVFTPTWDLQQVGLLAVTPQGRVRLWENLSLGSNKDYVDLKLPLQFPNEYPRLLNQLWPSAYLLITNKAMYRISVSNEMGSCYLSFAVVQQKQQGMLSRLVPFSLTSNDWSAESAFNIIPLKRHDMKHSREVCILGKEMLQKWTMSLTDTDKMVFQVNIRNLIHKSIERDLSTESYVELETKMEDAVAISENTLAILSKFKIDQGMYYFLIAFVHVGSECYIVEKKQISYQQAPEIKERSRLGFDEEGPLLFIFFKNAIMLTSIIQENEFEQIVFLQNQDTSILGFDTFHQKGLSREVNEKSMAVILCSDKENTVLQIEAYTSVIYAASIEEKSKKSMETLKVNLEQAIFYGSKDEMFVNPLSFDIIETSEDIENVCLDVSSRILRSESKHIQPSLDLRTQISERIGRMDQIISYVNDNQVLNNISEAGRWKLCFNVEKVVVCLSLWQYENDILNQSNQNQKVEHFNVLSKAIMSFMDSKNIKTDAIKIFFREYADNVNEILEFVQAPILRKLVAIYQEDFALLVHESSKILSLLYSSALEYRAENMLRYGLDSGPTVDPWLATPKLLNILQSQYELIENVLSKFPDITSLPQKSLQITQLSDLKGSPAHLQSSLRQYLCDIADYLLGSYRERILYLRSLHSPEALLELQTLEQTAAALQSKLIFPLVKHARKTYAYLLAEKYHNYQILVDLTLQDASKETRINDYIHRFQENFTKALYSTYLSKEMYLELLQQKPEYQSYLDNFLSEANSPWLTWIQDINMGRFDEAFKNLLLVVNSEVILKKKKTAISLTKLAFLSYFEDDYEESPEKECSISYLEKMMELVEVQEAFRQEFLKGMDSESLDENLPKLLAAKYKLLKKNSPTLLLVVTASLKRLLQGYLLSSSELIDLLTLIDDPSALDAFVASMEILFRSVPPVSDPVLLRNRIWRRAFLSTDWAKLCKLSNKISDNELKERLMETSTSRLLSYIYHPSEDEHEVLNNLIVEPESLPFDVTLSILGTEYPSLSGDQLVRLVQEYENEHSLMRDHIEKNKLSEFFRECLSLARVDS